MIHNDVHQTLVDVAEKQGWDEESQIIHLCGFIQHVLTVLSADKPKLAIWDNYLQKVAEEENTFDEITEEHKRIVESVRKPKCMSCGSTTGKCPCKENKESS